MRAVPVEAVERHRQEHEQRHEAPEHQLGEQRQPRLQVGARGLVLATLGFDAGSHSNGAHAPLLGQQPLALRVRRLLVRQLVTEPRDGRPQIGLDTRRGGQLAAQLDVRGARGHAAEDVL